MYIFACFLDQEKKKNLTVLPAATPYLLLKKVFKSKERYDVTFDLQWRKTARFTEFSIHWIDVSFIHSLGLLKYHV